MKVDPEAPINCCPYCGSEDGYYTKDYVVGSTRYFHTYDGIEIDNSEFHSPLEYWQGEYAYCTKCDKRLFKMSDLEE